MQSASLNYTEKYQRSEAIGSRSDKLLHNCSGKLFYEKKIKMRKTQLGEVTSGGPLIKQKKNGDK